MPQLIYANLRRRMGRTTLTAAGIGVGVAAVVALLSLTAGLTRSAGQLIHLGRADLGVFQKDAADPTSSVLPLSLIPRLRAQPGIVDATPLQLVVDAVPREPGAIVFGLDPSGFVARRLVLTAGRLPAGGEAVVGDVLARRLHLSLGDPIAIKDRRLRVAGIYHAGILVEDSGAIVGLGTAQALAGRTPDEATTIAVKLSQATTPAVARRTLSSAFPNLQVISDPNEAIRAGTNALLISKAVVLIVVLALIVGALAVANTMLTAVLERQREMALLSTVGWSPRQLAELVLGEAVGVSLLGTGFGLALGLIASELLPRALGLQDFVSPQITGWGLGRGVLIGVIIGVLGALYPIWRVTRVLPTEVLARG